MRMPLGAELRTVLTRPPDGLGRARWYYLIFALLGIVGSLPLALMAPQPPTLRALAIGSLVALAGKRIWEAARGRLARLPWDALEVACLLIIATVSGYAPALALFYTGAFFRAVLGGQWQTLAGTFVYTATTLAVGAVQDVPAAAMATHVSGLVAVSVLTFLLTETLSTSLRAVAEESQRTHQILDTASDAYIEIDPEGRITDWNRQAEAIFGWRRDEVLGRPVSSVIIPLELRAAHQAGLRRVMAGGRERLYGRRLELPAVHRTGRDLTIELTTWRTGTGAGVRASALLHDVTDRRHTQGELREARDRFRLAFHNAPIGIVLASDDGTVLETNQAFCRMLGRAEVEIVGQPVEVLTHPDDVAASVAHRTRAAAGEVDSYRIEKRYLHADGHPVPAILSVSAVKDATGRTQYFVGQVEDISEQKAAETALRRQQSFLEAVLENLDTGVVACDADGTLTTFNRASREIHGLPETSLPPEAWSGHYDLYRADGSTLLPLDEIPLYRALRGEHVRNAEIVVVPSGAEPRVLLCHGRPLRDTDGELLGAVVAMHDVTETRRAEAALSRQALHDPLTELANRLLLRDRLEHAVARRARHPEPMALLLLDLDEFKNVNDSLGHDAGDQVLVAVAERLRARLRMDDTVARLGGDEFAVLLENTTREQAIWIAQQLLDVIREPVVTYGSTLHPDASIGIVVSEGADSAAQMLRNADLAMYAAKAQGNGRVQVFEPSMHTAVVERMTLETELRVAVGRREFALHYQPIVSLVSGRLRGFEALLRWDHPVRGPISPTEFIPVAESTGRIVPLGAWVLREACRQAARWRHRHADAEALRMSVNLSVRQLQDPALVDVVQAALLESGLPPENLLLEITESIVMHRGRSVDVLERLRALGVQLAMDDFGTGYSSLDRLRSLPIDQIKIDKSFVDGIAGGDAEPIVAATIAMAHSLGLQAVAEGVEHADQLPFLRLHGCDSAQGYLFGRPADAETIDALLLERGTGPTWSSVPVPLAPPVRRRGADPH